MTEIKPPWTDKVEAEAMNFVSAVQQNFKYGIELAKNYAPNPNAPSDRAIVLDYFLDAIVGLTVNITSTYVNPNPEMEQTILKKISEKFAYVRKRIAETKAAGKPN